MAGVVRAFRAPPRTALAVGISLAHIGEFSLVMLAIANQLALLSLEVRQC